MFANCDHIMSGSCDIICKEYKIFITVFLDWPDTRTSNGARSSFDCPFQKIRPNLHASRRSPEQAEERIQPDPAACRRKAFAPCLVLGPSAASFVHLWPVDWARQTLPRLQFCRRLVLALSRCADNASLRMSVSSSLASSDQNATCPAFSGPISRF